jgi:hypothetical protein
MPTKKTVRARLTSLSASGQELPTLIIYGCITLVKAVYAIFVLDLRAVLKSRCD